MKNFTAYSKEKPEVEKSNILFDAGQIILKEFEGWTIVSQKDCVMCIIHLVEENKILLRQEYIPTYKSVTKSDYFLTVLSGQIEQGEDPRDTLFREIEEEAGLVIRDDFKFEIQKPLFYCKSNQNRAFASFISLTENDYHEIIPTGDGTDIEKKSKTVKIDIKFINNLIPSDFPTAWMIEFAKNELHLK